MKVLVFFAYCNRIDPLYQSISWGNQSQAMLRTEVLWGEMFREGGKGKHSRMGCLRDVVRVTGLVISRASWDFQNLQWSKHRFGGTSSGVRSLFPSSSLVTHQDNSAYKHFFSQFLLVLTHIGTEFFGSLRSDRDRDCCDRKRYICRLGSTLRSCGTLQVWRLFL